jgi:hypothetical protein
MNNVNSSKLDSYGMGVGIACAVHCAVLPLIFSSGFMASASWMDHMFLDIIFLVASLYFAFNSLVRSYGKEHNNVLPLLFAVVGFIIIGYI